MNLSLLETAAKAVQSATKQKKRTVIEVTAPSGRTYELEWTKPNPPTADDLARGKAKAQAMESEAQAKESRGEYVFGGKTEVEKQAESGPGLIGEAVGRTLREGRIAYYQSFGRVGYDDVQEAQAQQIEAERTDRAIKELRPSFEKGLRVLGKGSEVLGGPVAKAVEMASGRSIGTTEEEKRKVRAGLGGAIPIAAASLIAAPASLTGVGIEAAANIIPNPWLGTGVGLAAPTALKLVGTAGKKIWDASVRAAKEGLDPVEAALKAGANPKQADDIATYFGKAAETPRMAPGGLLPRTPPKTPKAPKPASTKPVAPKKPKAEAAVEAATATNPTMPMKGHPLANYRPKSDAEATGLARRFEDVEREVKGLSPTSKPAEKAEGLANLGKGMLAEGFDAPASVRKSVKSGKALEVPEVAAVAAFKRGLRNEELDLVKESANASPERAEEISVRLSEIDKQLDEISEAAQNTRTKFHDLGEALQVAFKDDFTFQDIKNKIKALGGGKISPKTDKMLTDMEKRLNAAEITMKDLRTELSKVYAELAKKTTRASGPTVGRTRRTALAGLSRLGVPLRAKDFEGASGKGGLKSKKAGAIQIPEGSEDQITRNIRMLAKSYLEDGVDNLDDIVARMKQDIDGIEDDQILGILSGKYRTAKLDADVAKIQIQRAMRQARHEAEYRQLTTLRKAGRNFLEFANTFQRGVQTAYDLSMLGLQGRKAIFMKPGSWGKAAGSAARAIFAKPRATEEVALKMQAELAADPLYKRAVQAKLSMTEVGGIFTRQEETFAGKFNKWLPGVERSEAAYVAFLNKLRFDMFRKYASVAPDNPEYLQDIAQMINIATGRGHGKIAQALSHPVVGQIGYAPRYAWSEWQYAALSPVTSAKTKLGKQQALKMYGAQVAAYASAVMVAKEFGWDVETDLRSDNFGYVKTPWGWQFDLFNKESSPVRLLWQNYQGRINKKGNYISPSDYKEDPNYRYFTGKLAPIFKDLEMARTGKVYDSSLQKYRDATINDALGQFAPIAAKEVTENPPSAAPLAIVGGRVQKSAPKSKAKPLSVKPAGWNR